MLISNFHTGRVGYAGTPFAPDAQTFHTMKYLLPFFLVFFSALTRAQTPQLLYQRLMASGNRELKAGHYDLAYRKYAAALESTAWTDEKTAARTAMQRAEVLRIQEVERERDKARALAAQADTLRKYLQGDSTYEVFLRRGVDKFRNGAWEEAQYDLAIARFVRETPEVKKWAGLVSGAFLSQNLAEAGHLEEAMESIRQVSWQDSTNPGCRQLLQAIRDSRYRFKYVIGGRDPESVDKLSIDRVTFLSREIEGLTRIQDLNLTEVNLAKLPLEMWQTIGRLTALKSLTLNRNDLGAVPVTHWKAVGGLKALQSLDLSSNNLALWSPEAWTGLDQLPNLQVLNLNNDSLFFCLPEVWQIIGRRTGLHWLYLRGNGLSLLPPPLFDLTNLRKLDLAENGLSDLPTEINRLANLETLDLSNNFISRLPPELGDAKRLQHLNLHANNLYALPAEIGKMEQLQALDLSNNHLTRLPFEAGQLMRLRELNLQGNPGTDFLASAGQLTNLQNLNLSHCGLSNVPRQEWAALKNLIHLQKLILIGNNILDQSTQVYIKSLLPYCEVQFAAPKVKALPEKR